LTSVKGPAREAAAVTVLIADDEPSIRLLVQVTIESSHCTVLEAADGDEAWSLITQHKPSLVLLDVQMPGRNGLDILKSIRSNPSLNTVRVIMLTSRATASDIAAGLAAGADLYLTKPFSPLDLLSRVQKTLHPSPS
jgi:DNA-binding response OmpR family regulator